VKSEHVLPGGVILVRRGKKAYHAVRVAQ
jgi:hypothetical protein